MIFQLKMVHLKIRIKIFNIFLIFDMSVNKQICGLMTKYPAGEASLLTGKSCPQRDSLVYGMKLHSLVILQFWRVWGHSFIGITLRFTLTQSDSTYKGPICGSNTSAWKILVLDRNTWNHIIVYKLLVFRIVTCGYQLLKTIFPVKKKKKEDFCKKSKGQHFST